MVDWGFEERARHAAGVQYSGMGVFEGLFKLPGEFCFVVSVYEANDSEGVDRDA